MDTAILAKFCTAVEHLFRITSPQRVVRIAQHQRPDTIFRFHVCVFKCIDECGLQRIFKIRYVDADCFYARVTGKESIVTA